MLCYMIEKLGKVVNPPNANVVNRMCILWITIVKKIGCLHIARVGKLPLYFRLKCDSFVGHYFHCGNLGHFMAECPQKVVSKDNDVLEMIEEEALPLYLDAPSNLPMVEPIDERDEMHHSKDKVVSEEGG